MLLLIFDLTKITKIVSIFLLLKKKFDLCKINKINL